MLPASGMSLSSCRACSPQTPFRSASRHHHSATGVEAHRSSARLRCWASAEDKEQANPFRTGETPSPPAQSTPQQRQVQSRPVATDDSRVESLEASIRRGKRGGQAPKGRQIPIRGVTPAVEANSAEFAPWREGQLFPEGWEQMPTAQKMSELYMGQRGFLFWASKISYAAAIGMLGIWVFFRFVGPNVGLYQLPGDFRPPGI